MNSNMSAEDIERLRKQVKMASDEYAAEQAMRVATETTPAVQDWDMAFVKAINAKNNPAVSPEIMDFLMLFCDEAGIPKQALVNAYARYAKGERITEM